MASDYSMACMGTYDVLLARLKVARLPLSVLCWGPTRITQTRMTMTRPFLVHSFLSSSNSKLVAMTGRGGLDRMGCGHCGFPEDTEFVDQSEELWVDDKPFIVIYDDPPALSDVVQASNMQICCSQSLEILPLFQMAQLMSLDSSPAVDEKQADCFLPMFHRICLLNLLC